MFLDLGGSGEVDKRNSLTVSLDLGKWGEEKRKERGIFSMCLSVILVKEKKKLIEKK